MSDIFIYTLGFLSQVLFFARNIAQWFLSEKEGEVISPVVYWQISLAASILMLTYGILRNDFAIVLGQFIVYLIYIRNLQLKKAWRRMHIVSRILAVAVPLAYLGWLFWGESYNFSSILKNEEVSVLLMIWGTAGQIIFTFRFIYQWIYSEKRKDSFLPLGFWIISTVGSLMIFTYAIYRLDPVLFAAHSLGLFIYIRNILLHFGYGSLFSKLEKIPFFNKVIGKIADKLK
ncbi:Uncharacterized N-terminal domain of lipid-A-disaccharide synthase [Mariniphaga anaerophila]|uniref:Uncharacterized N-terminal domain of lipid-A-disaccharide synthase n=1 Tax=Mariniphaga anaerophila TaxID=1484053 RepID=A0A1M5BBE5_9BACT|nr:lipid-A-disaccharide synthase N-terminal domain-containing protein [Mariniphaga anaerophila]SHF39780.1 Uncharacterized N-terminal domain of lipid-A-disaccharide synthase [Mariniphaga anaerophila]